MNTSQKYCITDGKGNACAFFRNWPIAPAVGVVAPTINPTFPFSLIEARWNRGSVKILEVNDYIRSTTYCVYIQIYFH